MGRKRKLRRAGLLDEQPKVEKKEVVVEAAPAPVVEPEPTPEPEAPKKPKKSLLSKLLPGDE